MTSPDLHDERSVRQSKLDMLRSLGVKLYPDRFSDKQDISAIRTNAEGKTLRTIEEIIPDPKNEIHTAGRIMLIRSFGKLIFGTLQDFSGQIQFALSKDFCLLSQDGNEINSLSSQERDGERSPLPNPLLKGEGTQEITPFKIFEKYIDTADIVGIHGELFMTHKGELTIFVRSFQLLSKALRPLGDKFHGIGEDNQETAYRQRYLDMIFNRETLTRMRFRADFIRTLREFYWKKDFLEIDCPILTPAASGAAAQPFVTHHHDFDLDFYLRICNETELKKATVGGFERVFTLAPNFRNEGSDPSHLQEFYMLEHQNVYKSFHEDMDFTQEMFDHIFTTLKLERKFEVKDKEGNPKMVDFTTPWPRIDYVEGVNKASGLNITSYSADDADKLRADIRGKGIEFEGMDKMGTMTLIDYLYKKVLRPTITGPAFVYNYPSIIAPLARISDTDPRKCEKWQVVVNGWEIINSYGELVDPIRQMENFAEQSKAEEAGDAEATSADMEFVKAMEYGMPIQAGFGMGIERIIAILTQQDNLRDVVIFPLMKPENGEKREEKSGKSKETKIAVVLLNSEAHMLPWQKLNTVAHLNAEFGVHKGKSLFLAETMTTSDGQKINLNIQHAIMIKEAPSNLSLHQIAEKAREEGLEISEFTREMIETTDDKKVIEWTARKNKSQIEYLGVLVFGNKKIIESITGEYPLYSEESKKNPNKTSSLKEDVRLGGQVDLGDNTSSASFFDSSFKKELTDPHAHISIDLPIIEETLAKYSTTTKEHNLTVGRCMRYFGQKLGKNADYWYAVGVLHDVDWDIVEKDMNRHCAESLETILTEMNAPAEMLADIRSHYEEKYPEHPLDTDLRKYLASVDELSGFIWACSRMTPNKLIEEVKVSSVLKKLKDKGFAAGVSREHCRRCETLLGISLEEFIPEMIEAMKSN